MLKLMILENSEINASCSKIRTVNMQTTNRFLKTHRNTNFPKKNKPYISKIT